MGSSLSLLLETVQRYALPLETVKDTRGTRSRSKLRVALEAVQKYAWRSKPPKDTRTGGWT